MVREAHLQLRSIADRDGAKLIDIATSGNLYITEEQGRLFSKVLEDPEYCREVVAPLRDGRNAMAALLTEVRPELGQTVVIDCGPSSPEESLEHLRQVQKVAKISRYCIVDMNSVLLDAVVDQARFWADRVEVYEERFEELARVDFHVKKHHNVVLIFGGTVMNYEWTDAELLLKKLTHPGDLVFLQALLDTTGSTSIPPAGYLGKTVDQFVAFPLKLLGIDRRKVRLEIEAGEGIIGFYFRVLEPVDVMDSRIGFLNLGDLIFTAFSRRPSEADEKKSLQHIGSYYAARVDSESRVMSSIIRR